jgi:hypothetical protein
LFVILYHFYVHKKHIKKDTIRCQIDKYKKMVEEIKRGQTQIQETKDTSFLTPDEKQCMEYELNQIIQSKFNLKNRNEMV